MQVLKTDLTLETENLGLRQSWLTAIPNGLYDFIAIIEDDVLLSRQVVPFTQMCIRRVLIHDSRVVGCSYYVNPYSDITNQVSPGYAKLTIPTLGRCRSLGEPCTLGRFGKIFSISRER